MQISKTAAFLLAAASVVTAQLQVLKPGPNDWWVAESDNVLAWTCKDVTIPSFTVQIAHDTNLVQPLPIIAIQNTFDCSIVVTNNQVDPAPGTGYRILLANIVNGTDIYASSEPFEIKPLGSLYPSQEAEVANKTATASGGNSSSTASPHSSASKPGLSVLAGLGLAGSFFAALL